MDIQSISLTYGVAIGILLDGMYVFLFCLLNNRNQARLQRNLMYLAAIADSQPQPSMHSQVVGFFLFYCFIASSILVSTVSLERFYYCFWLIFFVHSIHLGG